MSGDDLERGMVTDFKHTGWLKNFIDQYLDHKFIIDRNDPHFNHMMNGHIEQDGDNVVFVSSDNTLNEEEAVMPVVAVTIPGTDQVVGYELDVTHLRDSPAKEIYEGYFVVNFLPTSEHLSKWIYDVAAVKMHKLGVHVSRVDWFETPKSRSTFEGDAEYVKNLCLDVTYQL
jgi:6-pyruvoyltetrahydropterin/6-carboxytetrahydropterin synthase